MAKFRQPLFVAQPLPREPLSNLKSSGNGGSSWTKYFQWPSTFTSMVMQLGQSLHQMMASLVGLLVSCSDIFFLLAHILKILYDIVESVLSFVLAACNIIWIIIIHGLLLIVNLWDYLYYKSGLVYFVYNIVSSVLQVILQAVCILMCGILFVILVTIASNANHRSKTDQKFYTYSPGKN